ncbi:DUF4352 domain-containing protein [Nonomuraea endophytica]|uniref:DUF4352 domain-containing protein n=1 Tax=Nonomuraea endophytica TaxID=714136 RepID=A0A7W8A2Z5_9ACTN|nr:DUF4352 domain-containing protein [Nonomuraea endophytica]MBB5077796.1 hypothetical protein [Nonomuraea endophytica]
MSQVPRTRVAIAAAALLLGVAAVVVFLRSGTSASIGQAVTDGGLTMTVTKVEQLDRIGAESLGKAARGRFVVVHLSVKNTGTRAQAFISDSQKLLAGGAEYRADAGAAVYVDGADSKLLYEKIKPGDTITGALVFDVPKGVQPGSIELHERASSGGAEVNLQPQ